MVTRSSERSSNKQGQERYVGLPERAAIGLLRRTFRSFNLLKIEGRDYIPARGPAIIICNDLSYYFAPLLIQLGVPRSVRFVTWVRGVRYFVGTLMHSLGLIPVDFSTPDRRSHDAVVAMLKAGGVVGIFPEGARQSIGHIAHPKVGAARLAIESGASIYPVTITGNLRIWSPAPSTRQTLLGYIFPRPGRITLRFHPPILVRQKDRGRQQDRADHHGLTERVASSVSSRVEPKMWNDRISSETLAKAPASHVRVYEWLPFVAMIIAGLSMAMRGVWQAQPILLSTAAYVVYFVYVLADIAIIQQDWGAKLLRTVIAPVAMLITIFPALFEAVDQLQSAWGPVRWSGAVASWPFFGLFGRRMGDWWTITYLVPPLYLVSSLWTYYWSYELQFQKLMRGLFIAFYLALICIIIVPPLGHPYPVRVAQDQWGLIAQWFYADPSGTLWQLLNFPGFFVLLTSYLWGFDVRHQLPLRAAWYAPWALNLLLAALFWRGLPWNEMLVFVLLGWFVNRYLGAPTFLVHEGRWV